MRNATKKMLSLFAVMLDPTKLIWTNLFLHLDRLVSLSTTLTEITSRFNNSLISARQQCLAYQLFRPNQGSYTASANGGLSSAIASKHTLALYITSRLSDITTPKILSLQSQRYALFNLIDETDLIKRLKLVLSMLFDLSNHS